MPGMPQWNIQEPDASLGRIMQANDARFPLGNVFTPAQPSEEDEIR